MAATALVMDGDMTIVNAAAHREQLLAAVQDAAAGLHLDMGKADGVDSAGLQLLIATRHSLRRSGSPLTLSGMTPAVVDAIGVYGLQRLLAPEAAQDTLQTTGAFA